MAEDGYLFNEFEFDDSEGNKAKEVLLEASQKPRYVPARDEILVIGDSGYWPETTQSKALEDYLDDTLQNIMTPRDKEEIVLDLHFLFQRNKWRLNDVTPIVNNATKYMSKKQAESFMHLVIEMANNTRSWLNNGHTPNELFEKYKRPLVNPLSDEPFELSKIIQFNAPKIGRNEPCPCGSGQKFKRCCGK